MYLRNLVEAVLEAENGLATDDLRKRYTMEICTALSCVNFKKLRHVLFIRSYTEIKAPSLSRDIPSALAATNQISRFLKQFQDSPALCPDTGILPKLLVTACACGHVKMVQEIIQLEDHRANERTSFYMRKDHTRYLRVLADYRSALIAALQKGQRETGKVFFDYFLKPAGMERSSTFRSSVFRRVASHKDFGFVGKICQERAARGEDLTEDDIRLVLLEGTCSALRFLLENRYLDPNAMAKTTPLTLAVHNHRYDLARILLQYGADVNGVPTQGPPTTALCHVATTEYRGRNEKPLPGIRFLLEYGADPVVRHWSDPKRTLWPDVEFLLQQVVDYGNEVALRHETWVKYQSRKSEQSETLVIE